MRARDAREYTKSVYKQRIENLMNEVKEELPEDYILNQIKKMRRNMKHRYIQLEGEIAYSRDYVYFIFPSRALELAFALSLFIKCKHHEISCRLEVSKPVDPGKLDRETIECAERWTRRKLWRKCYKLKELRL